MTWSTRHVTLAGGHGRVPGVVPEGGLAAHGAALPHQPEAPVAGPAHHAVELPPGLTDDVPMRWGVRGTAVESFSNEQKTAWLMNQKSSVTPSHKWTTNWVSCHQCEF